MQSGCEKTAKKNNNGITREGDQMQEMMAANADQEADLKTGRIINLKQNKREGCVKESEGDKKGGMDRWSAEQRQCQNNTSWYQRDRLHQR